MAGGAWNNHLRDEEDMTELVPLAERMEYSKALSASSLLPRQYQNNPANVLVALEYGAALGLSPMAAIQGVHVVEGKPTASAQLIGALVRNAGHRLRVEGDDQHAVAVIVRRDDPEFEFRAEWTMDRAKQAGLAGKGVWKQYPAAMLKARAITEVARDACPEVLSGVAYTAEELGADGHIESPRPVNTARLTPKPAPKVALERVETVEEVAEVDVETGEILSETDPEDAILEAETVDELPADEPETVDDQPLTATQSGLITALVKTAGMGRADAQAFTSATVGRAVKSSRELTHDEAAQVIAALQDLTDAER